MATKTVTVKVTSPDGMEVYFERQIDGALNIIDALQQATRFQQEATSSETAKKYDEVNDLTVKVPKPN